MKLIIYSLLSYGITNIIVFGSIFNSWRRFWESKNPTFLGKLFTCPLCLSTWVGFILSTIFHFYNFYTPMSFYGVDNIILSIFLDGCLTSGIVWLIHTFQEYFEK